ncbi:hypothetical protein [Streptomyces clavuligerus]|uniref:Uncharacterized protein n=1 Tax=Streptomyces clavuligerus TaxID=1901 RepID=B5GWA2_STRCL|nr:hypothetical protein [Streptomyces clavuligerus]ANW17676.1 hypothetical protein BB341_05260 [Streptomyces clavuligerus]AXU12226.1 hypothetical protein D1794_05460 [Streptomyces clavuligerus]EDY50598.1 hypothetical protein SSCG_03411 [Streptomyces clavuligerus]EFG09801.1 Hypothetical protein SCLAV_4729 [Streptomyces clavuligerus]MBY6302096.1 hypothetical protein [Streptomyces clavuligerus]
MRAAQDPSSCLPQQPRCPARVDGAVQLPEEWSVPPEIVLPEGVARGPFRRPSADTIALLPELLADYRDLRWGGALARDTATGRLGFVVGDTDDGRFILQPSRGGRTWTAQPDDVTRATLSDKVAERNQDPFRSMQS